MALRLEPSHTMPEPGLVRRWAISIVMGLALCLAHPSIIRAENDEQGISKPITVVGGGNWNIPPFEFVDKDGKPTGFNVELVQAVAKAVGRSVEYQTGENWRELQRNMENGDIDVFAGFLYSQKRAKEYEFSNPHTQYNYAVFARRGTPPIHAVSELRGKEIVITATSSALKGILNQQGIKTVVLDGTVPSVLQLVASGKYDYASVGYLPGVYLARELKLTKLVPLTQNVASFQICFAVKKGNTALLADLNRGLAIVNKTGQYQAIYEKWFVVPDPAVVKWKIWLKYGLIAVIPLHLILFGTLLWSNTLKRQVAKRTKSLTTALHELQLHQKQLLQADKMAALGTLISGVAHEINNPNGLILISIPTLVDAYKDTSHILEEYYREHGDFTMGGLPYSRMKVEIPRILEDMQGGAQRIKRIVYDLKDFARRDDTGNKELLDFNTTVQAAVRLADLSIRKATDSFVAEYGEGLPRVWGNAQRIEQVVINLLINSCQALPDTSRSIRLSTSYNREAGTVVLSLSDEGVGIDPEHMSQLMDPFFTTKQDHGGTGLGLSVSSKIVRDHNGTLTFDSLPGEGTTVTLSLDIVKEELMT